MAPPTSPRRRLALALALLVQAGPALASPPASDRRPLSQAILERWTYRDGLPHNTVHRVLASRGGYLWIGTQEGLVRFDGVRFKTFAQRDTPGLGNNQINALLEDQEGAIWVGTALGVSRMAGGAFEPVDLGGRAAVTSLAADGEGGLWVATEARGVLHVPAPGSGPASPLAGLPDPRVQAMARQGETLWLGGYGGLQRLQDGRLDRIGTSFPADVPVTRLLAARDGALWIGTAAGLARFHEGAAEAERVPQVGASWISALLEDRSGAIWAATENGPVLRLVNGRAEPVAGPGSPASSNSLAEDADGDLWIGTESGGLVRLRWGQAITIAAEEGLAHDVAWAVQESRAGGVWVATDAGLSRVQGPRAQPAYVAEVGRGSLGGLLEDRAGALWVGVPDGLVRVGPGGTARYGAAQGLATTLVRSLLEARDGTLWVGTMRGLFRRAGERFVPLASHPGLAGDTINVLAEDTRGTLWVGTTTGLARREGERLVPAAEGGQPIRADVTALLSEADGTLWIGTVSEGLVRLKGGQLRGWTQREGLHEDTIFSIIDDGVGHLWLGGTHGISRVSRAELEEVAAGRRGAVAPLVLGTADGMRERECNGGVTPAAWRGRDGRLWFATIRGVVQVDPARLESPRSPPPAQVEEVLADGHGWPASRPLRFPPGTRRVELRYTGLALSAADRVRFRHRLVGLDDAPVDAGSERAAHFTSLGPGRYTFEVSASTAAGAWGPPATVAFEIEPHPWQTPWFAAAVAAAVLALAAATHLARTRALRRREALLAARVEEEMAQVKMLRGLLPTCAWCSKIKDEGGAWRRFEEYVSQHTEARFTHGMCPDCFARLGGDGPPEGGPGPERGGPAG